MANRRLLTIPLGPLPSGAGLRLRLRGVHHQAAPLAAEVFLLPDGAIPSDFSVSDPGYVGRLGIYGQGDFAGARRDEVVGGVEPFDVLLDAGPASRALAPGTPVWIVVAPDEGEAGSELRIDGAALEPFPR